MKVVIMGCGRTGSLLAMQLSNVGHDVTVIDWQESNFSRLPDTFPGQTLVGNALDSDVLVEAGLEHADAFVAATSGDNRNIMAGQIARHVFNVPKIVARIKDPNRADIFQGLGIQVDCRTSQGAQVLLDMVGRGALQQTT